MHRRIRVHVLSGRSFVDDVIVGSYTVTGSPQAARPKISVARAGSSVRVTVLGPGSESLLVRSTAVSLGRRVRHRWILKARTTVRHVLIRNVRSGTRLIVAVVGIDPRGHRTPSRLWTGRAP